MRVLWLGVLLLLFGLGGCLPAGESVRQESLPTAVSALSTPAEAVVAPTPIGGQPRPLPSPTPLPPSALADPPTPLPPATTTAVPTTPPTPTIPPYAFVNGLPQADFLYLPPETIAHMREVFARGQEIHGRDSTRFSKLGDSLSANFIYLTRFDTNQYELGEYAYLQGTIEHFRGSFARDSVGVEVGIGAISALGTQYADPDLCFPAESMFACEIRLHNPAILLIRFGTNDVDKTTFAANMQRIIEATLDAGIMPVLATKADRFVDEEDVTNRIIRQLAQAYQVPLWDFDYVANTLPNRGLGNDEVHLTGADSNDFSDPQVLLRGYPVTDLLTLMMLEELRAQVLAGE